MDPRYAREVLKGRLEFGNPEQIAALKVLIPPEVDQEGRKRYRVDLEVNYSETGYVYAENEEEAIEWAKDGALDDVEIEATAREDAETN